MDTVVNTYSPQDVSLTIGSFECSAWKSISIKRTVGFKTIRGIRGKNTRVQNEDSSATIFIEVMQTSFTNNVLSEIHNMDLGSKGGRLVLTLRDTSGSSVFQSNEGYIINYPEAVYSDDLVFHKWEIFCQTTSKYLVGGNHEPDAKIFEAITSAITGAIS